MHIILVSDRLATARSITLTWRHAFLFAGALFGSVLVLSSLFSYVTVRHAAEIRLPFLQDMVRAVNAEETQRSKDFVRENLNAMAVKLGEMQAQLMRLDTIGERLAAMAGVKPQALKAFDASVDGRGGPLVLPAAMSSTDLQRAVDALANQVEAKSDAISMIESQMLEDRIRKSLLPTSLPVEAQWNASTYGWRVDPFTGERAMHEGVDFVANPGTGIRAAAAGVVISSERHPQYGNMVEIDHGKDLTTRYAHASKLLVKPGQLVKRGQKIAEVGTTGRSTGPHLHFEVRIRGLAQNPDRFLRMAQATQRPAANRH
ncbi:MAG: metalloendopeptidase-like membrane protein [Rhodocyclaceae bacterium]|jgi:murein DD-endopeptidase MepM/ murein hydrolase activator NlpD|nr:MAG: metalloendopeptidase-like membrane protein [Rhodocyclaceae bacterium]TND00762.1 MAG: metalloendopeptidase-like membrane protein [Rhodocyclaceae bacterium]